MLRLSRITKRYAGRAVVDEIDLTLEEGRTCTLIGPSGCGKSTVLRVIIGLVSPDAGELELRGQPLAAIDIQQARAAFGYVIQSGGLFPHMTARENIETPAAHRGWSRRRIDERVSDLRGLTELPADALDRYPAQLSGGQRQRVSLMRALMLDPPILLLDEPLGSLDRMIRRQLQIELRKIFRSLGKTVLMVTHDLAEAAYFGDRIVLMRDGAIVQQGPIEALLNAPADAFVSKFVAAHGDLQ